MHDHGKVGGVTSFERWWDEIAPVGRTASGGYQRFAWTREDATLREWFVATAQSLGLDVVTDRAGNLWAWWGDPDRDGPGVVIGSHLDSVPEGGAFDGPLGVVSSFAAVESLQRNDYRPQRPIAVACFGDEEGARFGIACTGSRLLTGALDADRARGLTDAQGVTMAEALRDAGRDPGAIGPDPHALARVGQFVELHVEQGRALVDTGDAVGVGSAIWPHGRWRFDLVGRADHAGTTRLADRDDPMLTLAALIAGARTAAERHASLATVGKVRVQPNGVNAIPSQVQAWLDARGADEQAVRELVADLAQAHGEPTRESWTPRTPFDIALTERLAAVLGGAPVIETGAGHDAGVLAEAGVPTSMLFVRNPTGVSHSPFEHAELDDCLAGVRALTRVLEDLAS